MRKNSSFPDFTDLNPVKVSGRYHIPVDYIFAGWDDTKEEGVYRNALSGELLEGVFAYLGQEY